MSTKGGSPMVHQVFAVYDMKAKAHLAPFVKPTVGMAIRDFQSAVMDSGSPFGKFPADFSLCQLGAWDDVSGEFDNCLKGPITVAQAKEFVKDV